MMHKKLETMKQLPPLALNIRINKLKQLAQCIKANQADIIKAVNSDFSHRSAEESQLAEVMVCLDEIKHALKHIKQWTKDQVRHTNWKFFPSKCAISPQPKGVVGIMAPWNYPFNLVIEPLVAAIAAGNRVMVKPSEMTPNTAKMTQAILAKVFSEDEVFVVLGDVSVADAFSKLPLDHILFTGSTQVGKIVMRNASENLVPLTLELGGKSPVVIDDNYSINRAAQSIVQGKWFNAGQTCIAPDYILVSHAKQKQLIAAIQKQVQISYPDYEHNGDYTAIINTHHYQRLNQMLTGLNDSQIIKLGKDKSADVCRKMAPTLVIDPNNDHPVMQNEIFGPILPILTVDGIDQAIEYINKNPKPLTLYLFSNSKKTIKAIRERTQSGSLAINETLVHFAQEGLPFGGIGASGMGSYHGYQGFVAMSHMKSVYYQSRINVNQMVRAPFTSLKKKILKLLS